MEYPSNSQRGRDPEKKEELQKVITGRVIQKKKPLGRRFAETFMGSDARGVGSFVFLDVLLPALRDMVADTVTMGVERAVYGESTSPRSRRRGVGPAGHTPYNRMSAGLRPDPRDPRASRRTRGIPDMDDLIIETRVEAEHILDSMFNHIQKYESVSLYDLYDLIGLEGAYTDRKWGWTDLRGADVRRVREGYLLKLPQPEPL